MHSGRSRASLSSFVKIFWMRHLAFSPTRVYPGLHLTWKPEFVISTLNQWNGDLMVLTRGDVNLPTHTCNCGDNNRWQLNVDHTNGTNNSNTIEDCNSRSDNALYRILYTVAWNPILLSTSQGNKNRRITSDIFDWRGSMCSFIKPIIDQESPWFTVYL